MHILLVDTFFHIPNHLIIYNILRNEYSAYLLDNPAGLNLVGGCMACLTPNIILNPIGYQINQPMAKCVSDYYKKSRPNDKLKHQSIVDGKVNPCNPSYNINLQGGYKSPEDIGEAVDYLLLPGAYCFAHHILPINVAHPTHRVVH